LPPATDDTVMRLLDLYRHTDPALAHVLEERMDLAAIARDGGMDRPRVPAAAPVAMPAATSGQAAPQAGPQVPQQAAQLPGAQQQKYFAESAGAAASFLARPDGLRIGAL